MVNKGASPRVDYRAAPCRLDAAAWAARALDPGDAERFAEHLQTCRRCQLAVRELELPGRLLNARWPRPPARLAVATLARVRAAQAKAAARE